MESAKVIIILILFIIGLLILYWVYRKNFKRLTLSAVNLTTGAPKTGKTLLNVWKAPADFKSRHRKWWFKTYILRKKGIEEPLFYINQAFSFGNLNKVLAGKRKPHRLDRCIVKLSTEHLERKYRFNYKSVIYATESSLMSDNQDVNNQYRNAELSLFNKLIGHETRGGVLYYDTQNSKDNHYAIKRVANVRWFIQKTKNFYLFRILWVREMINEDEGENVTTDDIDKTTRKILIPFWIYRHYDCYYFSYLTDNLEVKNEVPRWYEGALDSFNPIYRKLSVKGVKKDEKKYF